MEEVCLFFDGIQVDSRGYKCDVEDDYASFRTLHV